MHACLLAKGKIIDKKRCSYLLYSRDNPPGILVGNLKYFKDIAASSNDDNPNPDAEYAVGIMKFRGEGTKKDVEAAREMFETQNDNPAALVGLAVYHLQYNVDYQKAIELLERAAYEKWQCRGIKPR